MGQWKLGYPNGLDTQTTYDNGKALYDKYSAATITLDSTTMCRAAGQSHVTPVTYTLTADNIINYPNVANTIFSSAPTSFEVDEFNNGYVRFLSGTCKDLVYTINDTTTTTLVSDTDLQAAGVVDGDYFEVVTGSCTYTFPSGRNPTRRDFKRVLQTDSIRFPYYEGGLVFPIGYEADDFVISVYLTDQRDFDRLQIMLSHKLDYKGFDALYSTGGTGDNVDGIAPMVLETGSTDILNQHLGIVNDYKIIKDAKRGDVFWEILIHMYNYHRVTYRGI